MDIRKTTESLHGLVLVNNDRVKWYEKAIAAVKDIEPSLADLFEDFAGESELFAEELDEKIKLFGKEDGIGMGTFSGKAFRVWSDIKSALSDNPVQSTLSSSEHVEDRVQEAYVKVLEDSDYMDQASIQLLEQHQIALKEMHDEIKAYRDESKTD